MQTVEPVYHYTISNEGAYTSFSYKRTKLGYKLAAPFCLFTFVPGLMVAGITHSSYDSVGFALLRTAIAMTALSFALVYMVNYLRTRNALEFKVSKDDFLVGNKSYGRDHVTSMFIKTPSGETASATVIVVHHSQPTLGGAVAGISSGISQMGAEAGHAIRKRLREASYKICIRYGTKDIVIAKGLGEIHAETLFEKVAEVSGMKIGS